MGNLLVLGIVAHFMALGAGWLLAMSFDPESEDIVMMVSTLPNPRRVTPIRETFRRRAGTTICQRNVFNFEKRPCVEPPPSEKHRPVVIEEPEVPPLCEGKAQLVGTVTSTERQYSFAMIETGGETSPYRIGEDVDEIGEIEQIGWRLVLFDRENDTDCLLDIYTEHSPPPRKRRGRAARNQRRGHRRRQQRAERRRALDQNIDVVSATERNVARSFVDELTSNPSQLMRTARVRPYRRNGQAVGFRLRRIRRNTLLSRLGFRNGDVVKSINGIDITSADRALTAYQKLRTADRLTVTIERRRRPLNLDFNIR